jgi:RNA polymerase sigma-70 factor (ECF subfamily)
MGGVSSRRSPRQPAPERDEARAGGGEAEPLVVRLGDADSFDVFYRRELPRLVALARALCGAAVADDVAQDAMLAAYRHWDLVCVMDKPDAWLRRVLVNRATSVLRRRASEARALLRLGSRPVLSVALEPASEDFWVHVRRLPRRQAQVVTLHYVEDLAVVDVATILDISPGAVKQHLSRARYTLATRMRANDRTDHGSGTPGRAEAEA